MKEHSGNPKGQRNKEEIDNLPEKYFNIMIGKMLSEMDMQNINNNKLVTIYNNLEEK